LAGRVIINAMPFLFGRLYQRLGARYFALYVIFEVVSAWVVCLATVGLFALYTETSATEFWRVVAVSEAAVTLAVAYGVMREGRLARPIIAWIRAGRPEEDALEVWRCAVAMPRQLVLANGWRAFAIVGLPVAIYATIEFDLPTYNAAIVFAGVVVAVGYAAILHFFGSELFTRPVLEDLARRLPPDFGGARLGVPLRWKLLGALPLINVITGVVASGLSTDGNTSLDELGLDVVVAVGVAFTISLELTLLLTRSILRPVDDLLEATEAVKRGDLEARVPVVSGDEMGVLAGSFNEMMEGLSERERLRTAFGSYVDPEVAERVLQEGELLEGEEREVTVAFVDVADFTARAERSSARETVAFLNDFFDVVVPCVLEHGGHANKFLGDGVLAVFGAPERMADHADRAVRAAQAIAAAVAERYGGEVTIGVGISSGSVVAGSVGGGGRLEFAVIGDPVNVAARVQGITRETGDVVLLTEATRRLMKMRESGVEARGEAELRGIAEPVALYSVATDLDERSTLRRKSLITDA
jgi:adenylate cyclase